MPPPMIRNCAYSGSLSDMAFHYSDLGRAFHLGSSSSAEIRDKHARNENTSDQLQPNCSASPLIVPPRTAPTEPHPLIQPAAVEVPRFEPKSAAAAPEAIESGAWSKNPNTKKPAPTEMRSAGNR